ncbi:MAG TPA: hypothetical protein VL096_07810 [Pirellulaceae bacterium]|nr:hypothetical protein [Pirellulaceae bacterium]
MTTPTTDDQKRDAFREGVEAALKRAAIDARELAIRTQTPLYIYRDGKVVDVSREEPKAS